MPTVEELEAELNVTRGRLATAEAKIKEVNDEAKGHRLNSDNFRKRAEDLTSQLATERDQIEALKKTHGDEIEKTKIDLTGRATAAETQAKEVEAKARNKVMMADLRVAARENGMVDLDALKLLDVNQAKLDDDGNVTNATDLMTAMKEAKPYLFGKSPLPGTVTGTTTSTTQPPPRSTPGAFNALTATAEEYQAQKQQMLSGVRR